MNLATKYNTMNALKESITLRRSTMMKQEDITLFTFVRIVMSILTRTAT